jgi:hypothetical protein
MTSPPQAALTAPARRVVMGRVTEVEEPYTRTVTVPPIVLYPVAMFAMFVDIVSALVGTVLRTRVASTRRPVKALRKGPEYMVTTIWVRDADDSLVELEVHGHLGRSAVIRGDRIRTMARRQKRADLPLLAGQIENLTTSRMLRPRRATLLTHLGLGLVLRAMLGAAVLTLIAGAFLVGHR